MGTADHVTLLLGHSVSFDGQYNQPVFHGFLSILRFQRCIYLILFMYIMIMKYEPETMTRYHDEIDEFLSPTSNCT